MLIANKSNVGYKQPRGAYLQTKKLWVEGRGAKLGRLFRVEEMVGGVGCKSSIGGAYLQVKRAVGGGTGVILVCHFEDAQAAGHELGWKSSVGVTSCTWRSRSWRVQQQKDACICLPMTPPRIFGYEQVRYLFLST